MNGQTMILGRDRSRAHGLVDRAPPGAVLNIREAARTNDQNAKMHVLLADVSRSKPGGRRLAPDQWKCLFMDAVSKETNNASFTSRWEPALDGNGVVNTGYRSSKLVKAEMSDLIEFIISWGTENNVEWSDTEATNG